MTTASRCCSDRKGQACPVRRWRCRMPECGSRWPRRSIRSTSLRPQQSASGCWDVPDERKRLEVIDALNRAEARFTVEPEVGHAWREKGERLLELGAGQVVPYAEVHACPEGQQPGIAAFSADVELGRVDPVTVAGHSADEQH